MTILGRSWSTCLVRGNEYPQWDITLGRSQSTCPGMCSLSTLGEVRKLAWGCAQWLSPMRHQSQEVNQLAQVNTQWVSLIRQDSRKKGVYLSKYMFTDYSWEARDLAWVLVSWPLSGKSDNLPRYWFNVSPQWDTTLGRSQSTFPGMCLMNLSNETPLYIEVGQLTWLWAQWVSLMRHHCWGSQTTCPISLSSETALSEEVC